jgi:hypothetical protein
LHVGHGLHRRPGLVLQTILITERRAIIMADQPETTETEQPKTTTHLRYDKMDTQFASQFILNASREEIIVNFSPGPLLDPQTNQQLLPINTRIAMTPQGAARLAQALANVLKNLQVQAQSTSAAGNPNPDSVN